MSKTYRIFKNPNPRRRIARRALRTNCEAVGLDGFRLLGERVLDLSPYGMLLAADAEAKLGESVVVSFKAPHSGQWIDADAEVARIVQGWRPWDPGYALGLRFTRISLAARIELREQLHGMPPPVPRRPMRRFAPVVRRA